MGEPPPPPPPLAAAAAFACWRTCCRQPPPLPHCSPARNPPSLKPPPAGMMAEAYFVFSIGNLKGIFKAAYPT